MYFSDEKSVLSKAMSCAMWKLVFQALYTDSEDPDQSEAWSSVQNLLRRLSDTGQIND